MDETQVRMVVDVINDNGLVEYDIRITKDKEIYNKNELIAIFRPDGKHV